MSLLARHREYAEATLRKDARLNIRISSKDLRSLQRRGLADGIPYQTLVASVLHKFVEGRLSERASSDTPQALDFSVDCYTTYSNICMISES